MKKLKTKSSARKAVDKYRKTDKGKQTVIKARKAHFKRDPDYHKRYGKEWRTRKKSEGLCIKCGKRRPRAGKPTCTECLAYQLRWYYAQKVK